MVAYSSKRLNTMQAFCPPKPKELEIASSIDRSQRLVGRIVEPTGRVRGRVIGRGRYDGIGDRKHGKDPFHGTGTAQAVTGDALGG